MPSMKRPAAAPSNTSAKMRKTAWRPHPAHQQQPQVSKRPCRDVWYCSDCSGLEVGALALKRIFKEFKHWFASEMDPATRKVLKATHPNVEAIFEDATKHDLGHLRRARLNHSEALLIYTSGFPCQPFSREGKRQGSADPRGQVVYHELGLINELLPDLVIFENVKDLATDKKYAAFFQEVLGFLTMIRQKLYLVDWNILDSYTHGPVPASRKRLYIVAVRKDRLQTSWDWPSELRPLP